MRLFILTATLAPAPFALQAEEGMGSLDHFLTQAVKKA
jgi:hypothetical protein